MRRNQPDRNSGLRSYEAPRLVNEGALVQATKEVTDIGEEDGGLPPLDSRDPAGSLGFGL